jgi:CheY-like chemotaxis protein
VKSIFENEQEGFTVVSAVDGKEALEKAEKELPDIILMDWQMPEMSGIEALKLLKQSEKTKSIPVLMLTASESNNEAFEHGANDFIQKPFNKIELIARVKTSLELVNAQKDLRKKGVDLDIQYNKLKIQKDILVKQKKELNEYHEIIKKISGVISPKEDCFEKCFQDYFILSLLIKEIPSNLIWTVKRGKEILFCIGFSSKYNALNAIFTSGIINILDSIINCVESFTELQPSQILSTIFEKLGYLNNQAISAITGFDLILLSFNLDKRYLQYSGINIPVYIVKNDKLVELKTDKIDTAEDGIKIANHKVHLAKGDLIYILNDGFNENKSALTETNYISDELIRIVNKIYKKEMYKQKELLDKTFKSWKKDLKQLNDILALGIKV